MASLKRSHEEEMASLKRSYEEDIAFQDEEFASLKRAHEEERVAAHEEMGSVKRAMGMELDSVKASFEEDLACAKEEMAAVKHSLEKQIEDLVSRNTALEEQLASTKAKAEASEIKFRDQIAAMISEHEDASRTEVERSMENDRDHRQRYEDLSQEVQALRAQAAGRQEYVQGEQLDTLFSVFRAALVTAVAYQRANHAESVMRVIASFPQLTPLITKQVILSIVEVAVSQKARNNEVVDVTALNEFTATHIVAKLPKKK